MRQNKAKRALGEGGVAIGTMLFEFNTTGMARILATTGVDFAMIDLEHTGWSLETVRMLTATAVATDFAPLVRVPASDYHLIARTLDVGAMGVMVPMVETVEQARAIVQATKYPPVGRRGSAFGIAHDDYQSSDVPETMASANREGLVIAMIETRRGVENVEQIAAVEGIDVLWLGHFDLTASLGIAGQFDHPEYQRSVDRIVAAAQAEGKASGFMFKSVEEGQAMLARGFRCLAYWGDLWIYQQALGQGVAAVRQAAQRGQS